MGKEIKEIRLGMCETREGDSEKLEFLVLDTMPNELNEFLSLTSCGVSYEFTQRVLEDVYKNSNRFFRSFSLDPVTAGGVIGQISHSIVVGISVNRGDDGFGRRIYDPPQFRFELRAQYPGQRYSVSYKFDTHLYSPKDLSDSFRIFVDGAIKEARQAKNPGLVFSRLLAGIETAHEEITRFELRDSAREQVRGKDAHALFREYIRIAGDYKRLRKEAEFFRDRVDVSECRVEFLEKEAQEAARALDSTKGTMHSKKLEAIRERLEAALCEDKSEEGS